MELDYTKFKDLPEDPFRNNLAKFVYVRTYSRWKYDLGRRETWLETCIRVTDYLMKSSNYQFDITVYEEIFVSIYTMQVMPSMRLMWSAGPAADEDNFAIYNCSYAVIDSFDFFPELMYILMHGTGAGYSVERQFISKIPAIKPASGEVVSVVVQDSKRGWYEALKAITHALAQGHDIKYDLSLVRPKGALLKTFGGRASGPEPLEECFKFFITMFTRHRGRKLSSINCHDLACKVAEAIVVGGVRRSALISLSDLYDEGMRGCKNGQFWITHPMRQMSNNSAVYEYKPLAKVFMKEWLSLVESDSGERGVINRSAFQKLMPKRRTFQPDMGCNPCSEIILRNKGLCNLSEVVIRPEDTFESIINKVRVATIIGTIQSGLTKFAEFISPQWKKNAESERLLGVSLTGQMDNPDILTEDNLEAWRDFSIGVNVKYSRILGINRSKAITCTKPSGTASQLVDSASGFHSRFAPFYIRRVRISASDPLYAMMKEQGVKFYPEVGQVDGKADTYVCEFFVKAPDKCITAQDVTAISQLEQWMKIKSNWAEHTVSATIYVEPDEWLKVGNWVYENFDDISGLSFLPKSEHVYPLAPYQAITKEQYEEGIKAEVKIDYSLLTKYEQEDMGEGSGTLSCEGDKCILK